MNQVILKNSTGLYYVEGSGFITNDASKATRLDASNAECTVKCASKFGISVTTEAAPITKSYGVGYIRKSDLNADGSVVSNNKNPSRRRFATEAEARTHAARYHVRKARYGAVPGSAGHIGAYVIETNDPVNAVVNPATGLTNPAPGFPRSFSARQAALAGRS